MFKHSSRGRRSGYCVEQTRKRRGSGDQPPRTRDRLLRSTQRGPLETRIVSDRHSTETPRAQLPTASHEYQVRGQVLTVSPDMSMGE